MIKSASLFRTRSYSSQTKNIDQTSSSSMRTASGSVSGTRGGLSCESPFHIQQ